MRRLDVNQRDFITQTDSLLNLSNKSTSLDFDNQLIISELILVRLFSLMELHFESITLKVLCNTPYLDATSPTLLANSSNITNAISNIMKHGRAKVWKKFNIKWNTYQCIQDNVKYLLDPTDNLLNIFNIHSAIIEEMRLIRNHIAHNTADTRSKYKPVVINHYGAYVNTITPGKLLLSPRQNPNLLKQYLITSKIIVRDLVKG